MNTDEKGQILPVSLFGLALLCLCMLLVFNTSQLSSKKQRLNDAADAAAYSAALYQARSLNSVAYTNRAMIANQVFIGQMVSVENYLNYWNVKTRNLQLIPVVGPAIATPINQGINSIQQGLTPFIAGAIQGTVFVNKALSVQQELVVLGASAEIPRMIDNVLDANDSDISLTPLGYVWVGESVVNWQDNLEKKDSNQDLKDKVEMINASRDPFTAARNYETKINFVPNIKIVKHGNTTLTADESGGGIKFRWDALDILSITRRSFGWRSRTRNLAPIGWSRRSVSTDNTRYECPNGALTCDGGRAHRPTMALARTEQNESMPVNGFEVNSYHELNPDVGFDPRFPISLSVKYDENDISTSDQLPNFGSRARSASTANELGAGVFYQESKPLNENVEAVSRAEVFFRRPVHRRRGDYGSPDSADEFANVWNPYWSARLVDATNERNQARALKGIEDIL